MRRTTARGRIFPQSLSTEPRYGKLSLKARALYPLMLANCDDQGRLTADPEELKYAVCPAFRDIAEEDIARILDELEAGDYITVYPTTKSKALQVLDWWDEQKLQWAWPSRYPAPPGWQDRLRYKPDPKEIITQNWEPRSQKPQAADSPPQTPPRKENQEEYKDNNKRKRKRKRNVPGALGSALPSALGSASSASSSAETGSATTYAELVSLYEPNIGPITPLVSDQLRDFAASYPGPMEWISEAFKEAVSINKRSWRYIQRILECWVREGRTGPLARRADGASARDGVEKYFRGKYGRVVRRR